MKRIYFFLLFVYACDTQELSKGPSLEYSFLSESVLHLVFGNDPSDSLDVSAFVMTNIPRDGNESNIATVVKAGDYYLALEVDRPTQCLLTLEQEQYNIFVFPKDTTEVIVRNSNGTIEISFAGEAQRINEYYLRKKESLGYTDIRFPLNATLSSGSTYSRLLETTDSIVNRELTFFEDYTSSVPLPNWFKDYEESEITYAGAGYKAAMPHSNELLGYFKDTLPTNYYDFLKETEINNPRATASAHYFWFLDDYFLRNLPVKEMRGLSGFSRISKATSFKLNRSKNELSDQVKDLYHMSIFSSLIKFYSDSLAIDSLAKSLELTNYEELVRVSGTRSRNELLSLNLHKGDTIPNFILTTTLDSLISIRDFSHQYLYVNFWATWCGPCLQNIPELNKLIDQYESNTNITFLNICLESEHAKWLASIGKHKLRGINLYAEGNWNSKLRAYFNIAGIPHYAIINRQNILAENATDKAPDVKQKIDALLDKDLE